VSKFAVFVSGCGVRLCVIMLADIVKMGCLMMMVRCSMMVRRGDMVLLTRRMLR
jgi:hypothetical protein